MLRRTLASVAAALALGGVAADAASASTMNATPSIRGAGSIAARSLPGLTCEQAPPVSDDALMSCPNVPWTVTVPAWFPAEMSINATPAPGWSFAGWAGCDWTSGALCYVVAGAGTTRDVAPQAKFVDRTPPAAVADLKLERYNERNLRVRWTAPEPGLSYRCKTANGTFPCLPGLLTGASEGKNEVSVWAVDASGNAGPVTTAEHVIVDTVLHNHQPETTPVRTVSFSARSGIATAFECSVDDGPWAACGTPTGPHALTPLTLPAVADGPHTLSVRGRYGMTVDSTPALRRFVLDTTPPETTIAAGLAGLDIHSSEPGELYCRVDDQPFELCGPRFQIPLLGPGTHTFEAYAVDALGHADPTPAKHTWTVAAPKPPAKPAPAAPRQQQGPPPVPAAQPEPSAPPATAAPALVQPQRFALALDYRFRAQRFSRFAVKGIPGGTKLVVTVKRPRKAATRISVAKLVGKRLPNGTRLTVRAGTEIRRLTIRRGRVIA
jgi:hypothetical protein